MTHICDYLPPITFRFYLIDFQLRGYCTPYEKLACFVLYLEIINTLSKNNIICAILEHSMDNKMVTKI